MASSLYDVIKANQEAGAGGNKTRDFKQTVLAKSGRAVEGTEGPQKSSIAETAALQAGQAAQTQLSLAETQQDLDLSRQEEAAAEQHKQTMGRLNIADEKQQSAYLRQTANIATELQRNLSGLSQERRNAQIEQAGFLLGLSNKKYVQELEQAADTKRLWDSAQFEQELMKSTFENDYDLWVKNDKFNQLFNQNERDLARTLAKMGIREKLDLANMQIQQENTRAVATGATDLLKTGLDAWAKSGSSSSPSSPSYTGSTSSSSTDLASRTV